MYDDVKVAKVKIQVDKRLGTAMFTTREEERKKKKRSKRLKEVRMKKEKKERKRQTLQC